MDWGSKSPAVYTIGYIIITATIQIILLFALAFAQSGGGGSGGAVDLGGVNAVDVGFVLVFAVTPVYVLFFLVNSLITGRIQEYHRRSHGLPAPEDIEESDLTEIESIDRDTAEKLFESGYKSTEHINFVDARTSARQWD